MIKDLTMRKILSLVLVSIFLLTACGPGKRNPLKNLKRLDGERYAGSSFKYNEVEYFKSIYPLEITEVVGYRLASQVYQGLVSLNQQDLLIEPCIAKFWDINENSTVYTFQIRKDVFFHDDACFEGGKGRAVKASDFKYCFDKLCASSADNQSYDWFRDKVFGAKEYFQSTVDGAPLEGGVEGIWADDEKSTLTIRLNQPFSSFLNILAMVNTSVFAKEAVEKYGDALRTTKAVGTGPFILSSVKENDKVILKKNSNYWEKDMYDNPLPYLNAVEVSFIRDDKTALMEFEKGNLDLMYKMPLDILDEIIDDKTGDKTQKYEPYQLQKTPALKVDYLGFLHTSKVFEDEKVRTAFNLAVDRKKLIDYTLKGTAIMAKYGIVPPAVVGYNTKSIKGYKFSPEKARALMAEAGYANGEGFPQVKLQINSGGGRHKLVCEAISNMLKDELNVDVQIEELPWAQHLDKVESGSAPFYRSGWVADYPDPENFLQLYLGEHLKSLASGKSYLNTPRYNSDEYDSLYYEAISILDDDQRYEAYLKLDQNLVDASVIMPLYYEYYYRLVQPYVVDFDANPMEFRNFKDVYFSPIIE